MKLTDKCKKDFEWYYDVLDIPHYYINVEFKILPESMQYGVYVDFFDSLGFNIWTYTSDKKMFYYALLTSGRYLRSYGKCNSRAEARSEAIKKANEIYNNSNQ